MIWRSTYHSRIVQLTDIMTAFLGFIISFYLWDLLYFLYPQSIAHPFSLRKEHLLLFIVFSFIYVLLFNINKAYSYQRFTSLFSEYTLVVRVCFLGGLLSLSIVFLIGYGNIPRILFLITSIFVVLLFLVQKTVLFYFVRIIRKQGRNRKRIILVGTNERAEKLIKTINEHFEWGLDIIGLLTGDENKIGKEFYGKKVLDHHNNIREILKQKNPEEVIITTSTNNFDQIRCVFENCEREGVQVRLNSDFLSHITKNVRIDNVYGLNIMSFYPVKQNEIELLLKRILDIAGAILGIIIFSPFMLVAALGIMIADGRPILYTWNVIGLNKKPVKSWKFRTMIKNADEIKNSLLHKNEMKGPVFKIKNDPRIIPFCGWIRKWSIDETPQFFSVLKGDLSLVGPRPAGPKELEQYESWQRRKLSVKPGLTCLWQANGRNKINDFNDWVKLDLEYIDNWSFLLDLKILLKTIPSIIFGKGAS